MLGRRVGFLRRVAPPLAHDAAAAVNAVLVSHLHGDHVDVRSLRRVGHGVPMLAPPAAARWLRRRRFRAVRELAPGEAADVDGVTVHAVAALHDGRRWPAGKVAEAVGFLVESAPSVYFAGDTDLFPSLRELRGRADVALLPVSGWGPRVGPGHLDPERAAEAAALVRPSLAIPIHWGTLARPWSRPTRAALERPAREFAAAVEARTPEVEVIVLEPGQSVVVSAPRGDAGAPAREAGG